MSWQASKEVGAVSMRFGGEPEVPRLLPDGNGGSPAASLPENGGLKQMDFPETGTFSSGSLENFLPGIFLVAKWKYNVHFAHMFHHLL